MTVPSSALGRSMSLPLWNVAPARTRATRCGALTARPAVLSCLDQLERHRQTGRARAGTFGDFGAVPDGGERRLDRIRGAQVHPMLGPGVQVGD